jgi:hypothetical protein
MNELELKRAVLFASALRRIAGPLKARFWEGYNKGLDTYRQYVKGLSPAAAQQHLAFLAHAEGEDLARCLFGLGYRSGYDGDFFYQACAKWRALGIEDQPYCSCRPAGFLRRKDLKDRNPASGFDLDLAIWVEQEASKMGISVLAYVRLKLSRAA